MDTIDSQGKTTHSLCTCSARNMHLWELPVLIHRVVRHRPESVSTGKRRLAHNPPAVNLMPCTVGAGIVQEPFPTLGRQTGFLV
jgi:hypothetical protein